MASEKKPSSPTAEELFDSLTLDDKSPPPAAAASRSKPDVSRPPPPPGGMRRPPPPGARRGPPPPNHRPTRSQEEALRARRAQAAGKSPFEGSSRSPSRRVDRRPRRNSESSVLDSDKDKTLTEEERKARELRRRERERRHRENRDKKPVNRKLDIIDQLDATSIYGTGLFHHDGPFDALNPHRNRRGSSRAPMQAFPKDSVNNTLGGAGPLNKRPDHATLMGHHDEEAFKEWSSAAKDREGAPKAEGNVWDPMARGSIIYGDESLGLGASTFLEGTPAARAIIQKREEEQRTDFGEGLQRKKSLAQRIRNINRNPRDFNASGRLTNPEAGYVSRRSPRSPNDFGKPSSASEQNPFFAEYDTGKGGDENISVRKTSELVSSEPGKLERRATTDATSAVEGDQQQASKQPSGGLLARVKSLKGGPRKRPAPPPPFGATTVTSATPGTAV